MGPATHFREGAGVSTAQPWTAPPSRHPLGFRASGLRRVLQTGAGVALGPQTSLRVLAALGP